MHTRVHAHTHTVLCMQHNVLLLQVTDFTARDVTVYVVDINQPSLPTPFYSVLVTGSIPRCGKGFFSHSQLSVQTLLRVSVHLRVQSDTLTSVRA